MDFLSTEKFRLLDLDGSAQLGLGVSEAGVRLRRCPGFLWRLNPGYARALAMRVVAPTRRLPSAQGAAS
jgi:hypothetical protein